MPIALAQSALGRRLGQTAGAGDEKLMLDSVELPVSNWDTIATAKPAGNNPPVCYYGDRVPSSLGTESVLNALVLVEADSVQAQGEISPSSAAALEYVWEQHQADGSWLQSDVGGFMRDASASFAILGLTEPVRR